MSGINPFYIGVTGSRMLDEFDRATVIEKLETAANYVVRDRNVDIVWVHGDCETGADKFTDDYAVGRGDLVKRFRADWYAPCDAECFHAPRRLGMKCKSAGPKRNTKMIKFLAKQENRMLLAFPLGDRNEGRSRGTYRCIDIAKEHGITPYEIKVRK